jgi:hypothetical protein
VIASLPLAFTAPAVLAALVMLPALYWLLRLTPPPPRRVPLPTLALVRDLDRKEETPAHTPWWLLLLRLLFAALVILAMAGPLWNPNPGDSRSTGPLLVVIDNGWAAASGWREKVERARLLIEAAGADGRPVALRATGDEPVEIVPGSAARAQEQLRGLALQPHTPERARQRAAIETFLERHGEGRVAWIADGVTLGADGQTVGQLAARTGERMTVFLAEPPDTLAMANPLNAAEGLSMRVLRAAAGAPQSGTVKATDSRGRPLGEARFTFPTVAVETSVTLDLPLELRNEVTRLEIVEQASAGSVALMDSRSRRKRVGLVSGESTDTAQPLVSPAYFVQRALAPFAEVREVPRGAADPFQRLIEDGAGVIVLTDVGSLSGEPLRRLQTFVENGGVLIRFASRRAAAPTDPLMPVRLRRSERVMGGALSWDTPRKLASFAANGPFDGLAVPADVTVSRQILAEPEPQLTEKTWAMLEDGTPLITGERRGKGVVALFHITADTTWSSLPLSGAFVETLRRLAGMALAAGGETVDPRVGETAPPIRTLDGTGVFRSPPATAQPIQRSHARPAEPQHPPGFYGAPEAPLAVNTLAADATLAPLDLRAATVRPMVTRPPVDLRPWLLTAALLLFLVDALAAIVLSGGLAGLVRRKAAQAAAVLLCLLAFAAPDATAQTTPAPATPAVRDDRLPAFRADDIESALATRLAYVITGDRTIDDISRSGLAGLTKALALRTALEPAEPIGVDPARDELVFYPLLYWPMAPSRPPPSEEAIRRLDAFMKQGGTVVFDTRDALNSSGRPGAGATPETQLLRRILNSIDVPDLEPVPKDHVVTKTFYILENFVGRYASGQTWLEVLQRNQEADRSRPAQAGDRVSPIIITSNDLAAAWAVDRNGAPRFPLVPGDGRQREMALRGGVNIVMYSLTGNYKADQVHIPALLERLGQ